MVVRIYENDDRYEGDMQDGMKHGKGTLTYVNGGRYVGEWQNDMRHGQGVNTWANGDRYEGGWQGNKKHGQGTFTYADKGKYVGEWANDLRHGQGVNTWANGDRYEGNWKNNRKHGQGIFHHTDGTRDDGEWKFDKQVAPIKKSNPSGCSITSIAREFVESLKWPETIFDTSNDRCYCTDCYHSNWKDVIDAGDGKYVIPRGWTRFGLRVDPVFSKAHNIWEKWIVTYHGTTKIAALSILTHRQFCLPGDKLIDGTVLGIRAGHIPNQKFIFTSPTIAYSSSIIYSPIYHFHSNQDNKNYEVQMVLQCRQMPETFQVQRETIGLDQKQICQFISNEKIEYFTDRRASLVAYGLLIRIKEKTG